MFCYLTRFPYLENPSGISLYEKSVENYTTYLFRKPFFQTLPPFTMAKKIKKTAQPAIVPTSKEFPQIKASSSGCAKVWNGSIARLRIYDQPGSTGQRVFAYVAPGRNSNYIGNTDDPTMIKALFLARDNGNSLQGYTNAQCRIEWIDY